MESLGIGSQVRAHNERRFSVPAKHEERGVHVVEGEIEVAGQRIAAGEMVVIETGAEASIHARERARVMVFGGAPLGPRYVWWNFVSSRADRIHQAADDWKAGRFAPVPGETEFIPLPEGGPKLNPVNYP